MFSWYKYLIVSLVFSHLGFWSGNLFLIAPFPDLCLLVPFHKRSRNTCKPVTNKADMPPFGIRSFAKLINVRSPEKKLNDLISAR